MILEFERPIIDLEKKISELRGLSTEQVDFSAEIRKLELREAIGKPFERIARVGRPCAHPDEEAIEARDAGGAGTDGHRRRRSS